MFAPRPAWVVRLRDIARRPWIGSENVSKPPFGEPFPCQGMDVARMLPGLLFLMPRADEPSERFGGDRASAIALLPGGGSGVVSIFPMGAVGPEKAGGASATGAAGADGAEGMPSPVMPNWPRIDATRAALSLASDDDKAVSFFRRLCSRMASAPRRAANSHGDWIWVDWS